MSTRTFSCVKSRKILQKSGKLTENLRNDTKTRTFWTLDRRRSVLNHVGLEHMLQDESLVAPTGVDTAENGPSEIRASKPRHPTILTCPVAVDQQPCGVHARGWPFSNCTEKRTAVPGVISKKTTSPGPFHSKITTRGGKGRGNLFR